MSSAPVTRLSLGCRPVADHCCQQERDRPVRDRLLPRDSERGLLEHCKPKLIAETSAAFSGISARVGRTGNLRWPGSRLDVLLLAELHDRVQLDASPGQPSRLQRAAGRSLRAPGRRVLFANRQLVYKGVSDRRIRTATRGRASIQLHGKARGQGKSNVKAKQASACWVHAALGGFERAEPVRALDSQPHRDECKK